MNEFLHPREDRPLTVRECARLQTFPDTFKFCGSRRDRIQLIGNAVPPLLAESVGWLLSERLRTARPSLLGGALLSFSPTPSEGMSPALRAVADRVSAEFGWSERARETTPLWA